MTHIFHRPRAPLDALVDFIWVSDGHEAKGPRERVLPSGVLALVISLGTERLTVYEDDDALHPLPGSSAFLCGARVRPLVIGTQAPLSTIGVHFKAGGARPFLGAPVGTFEQQVVPLDALWGSGASTLRDRLAEAPTHDARVRLLEDALLQRLQAPLTSPGALSASLAAFEERDLSSVAEVCRRTDLSPKRLLALFRDEVGLSPKAFWRVRRFRAALRSLEHGAVGGAALAADHGYFDQAHFIREFHSLAGSTPREFLAARVVGTDHVSLRG